MNSSGLLNVGWQTVFYQHASALTTPCFAMPLPIGQIPINFHSLLLVISIGSPAQTIMANNFYCDEVALLSLPVAVAVVPVAVVPVPLPSDVPASFLALSSFLEKSPSGSASFFLLFLPPFFLVSCPVD